MTGLLSVGVGWRRADPGGLGHVAGLHVSPFLIAWVRSHGDGEGVKAKLFRPLVYHNYGIPTGWPTSPVRIQNGKVGRLFLPKRETLPSALFWLHSTPLSPLPCGPWPPSSSSHQGLLLHRQPPRKAPEAASCGAACLSALGPPQRHSFLLLPWAPWKPPHPSPDLPPHTSPGQGPLDPGHHRSYCRSGNQPWPHSTPGSSPRPGRHSPPLGGSSPASGPMTWCWQGEGAWGAGEGEGRVDQMSLSTHTFLVFLDKGVQGENHYQWTWTCCRKGRKSEEDGASTGISTFNDNHSCIFRYISFQPSCRAEARPRALLARFTSNTATCPKVSGKTERPFSDPSHPLPSQRRRRDLLMAHPSRNSCVQRASAPAPTSNPGGFVLCARM